MEISFVLAGYNEEKIARKSIQRCINVLEKDFDDYELILVDDASKDKTLDIMKEFAKNNPHITVLENKVNLNFGTSVLRGIYAATKTWIIFDAMDLPFRPEQTKDLILYTQKKEYDVLVLQRTGYKTTLWRKITSKGNLLLLNMMFPHLMKGTPVVNYVQIFRKSTVSEIIPLARSPIFVWPEMIFRAKLRGLNVGNIKNKPQINNVRKGAFGHPHDIIWGIYDMVRFKVHIHNI